MTVHVTLRSDGDDLIVSLDGEQVADPVPLADLPALPALVAAPYVEGGALTRAVGGDELLARLDADPDRLLLLEAADERAAAIPWEYAALGGRQFLGCRYGLVRLVDRAADPAPPPDTLRFLVLGADPLVDGEGNAREGYRLATDRELRAIRRTLKGSEVDLVAQRIPPTADRLHAALMRGPAVLHVTCHGTVIDTDRGPMAMLLLEDESGGASFLHGPDLANLPTRGALRLIVLSACKTASPSPWEGDGGGEGDHDATLARALVRNGIPAAIGMQGKFPDEHSDDFAVPLYRHLLAGRPLSEALRQARVALSGVSQDAACAGLPVCYVAREAWGPLPLRPGPPNVPDSLRLPGDVRLAPEVEAPRPLHGRNAELHGLARLYAPRPRGEAARVVTVVGSGGVGKTALAAGFAERFGWRWPDGVLGLSFAAGEPDAARFRADLLRGLLGEAAAQSLADAPAGEQARLILERLRDRDGLLLLDNYESVLQGLEEGDARAAEVHRLVARAARGGASLLLTSRQQPAKLRGERVFPRSDRPLPGLAVDPGAALFLEHSTRATDEGEEGRSLAQRVADVTEGHPLAVALLAGEYDDSPVSAAEFLAGWGEELAQAEDYGLAGHHRTFAAAFDRSYRRLRPALRDRLRALSRFPFPFFAEGAAAMWGLSPGDEDDVAAAREELHRLTQRSLLEVAGQFEGGTPATYRFQPALRQAVMRRVAEEERAALEAGFAAYGAWLARRGYGDIHKDPALARVVRLSMEALEAATERLAGEERLWHVRWLVWLKGAYGQTREAYDLLESVLPIGRPLPDGHAEPEAARVESSLRYELAKLCLTRGDLDRALALYQESLQLSEQIGDLQGKAASLHEMAQVYRTRGDLDRALALYQESLQLSEQIGDLQGKAASLSQLADLYMMGEDWDKAEHCLQEALSLSRRLGESAGIAFKTVKLGQVAQARGDRDATLARYREGLAIFEELGMPRESAQVRGMIASLEGEEAAPPDPLQQLTDQARAAIEAGEIEKAIAAQERAVSLVRQALEHGGESREGLVTLSVLLYNLAGYYGQAERHDEAVTALEEVALDERTDHPDLESDRGALEQARRVAALSPEERAQLAAQPSAELDLAQLSADLEAQLAQLPPEERAQLEAAARQFARQWEQMGDEERAQHLVAAQAAARRQQIASLADQARDGAIAARQGQLDPVEREALIARIKDVAAQAAEGEEPGSPWDELAAYLRAVAALLRGEPSPPVPESYAAHMAAIREAT
jgi:tetratricopeptide (TPR) repeat protein